MKQTHDATDGARSRSTDTGAALAEIEATLAALTPDLAPERVPGHRMGQVVAALTAIEARARGVRLVLRKAAADTGAWKAAGARSAAEHMAKQEGISVGQARSELAASEKLATLPAARDAAASGAISVEKAKAVAEGAAADPTAERKLVDTATTGDLRATQDEARRAVVRADERSGDRARRVHRRRSLTTWLTVDGEGHGRWSIPAESHHRFMAALEPYRQQVFRDARAIGVRLPDEALMADALDMLARDVVLDLADDPAGDDPLSTTAPDGGPPDDGDDQVADDPALFDEPDDAPDPSPPSRRPASRPTASPPRRRHRRAPAQVMVLVDDDALVRGHAGDGETCEINGLGPVPVSLARHIMDDALLRLIVTGTDITLVSSHRRYVSAELRAAIWARDRGTCVVPGCHATRGLEIDHCHRDVARDGPTALGNSALLCKVHHVLKTVGGWTLGGNHDDGWTFVPADGAPGPP